MFDPSAGMFGSSPGSGVLAMPQTPTQPGPIQNPMDPENTQATLAAMAQARAKQTAMKQALLRAAVLRDQPGQGFAQGKGPLGIRIGEGPGGWMVSLGDAVAGLIQRGKQKTSEEDVSGAMGALSPAEQEYVNQYLKGAPGAPQTGRSPMSYVPQGAPLSLG